jgi:hypothetical protein
MQGLRSIFIHKLLIVASTCISLLVLFVTGALLLSWSINTYPSGTVALLPWAFGVAGVAGLLRSWPEPESKSALRLRTDAALLSLGVAGACVFCAVSFLTFGISASGATLAAMVLPPLVVAGLELRKSLALMHSRPLQERGKLRDFWAVLLVGSLAVVALRVLAQEAVMAWYGYNLVPAAYASAEKIAAGKTYCVIDQAGAETFETLDKRRILLAAVQKSHGFHGMNYPGKDPHFGIAVDDQLYWWSFTLREFRALPGRGEPSWALKQACVPAAAP